MSHIYFKTYYHLVWTTKGRMPVIDEKIEELLRKIILRKVNDLGGVLINMNMVENHIHLLLSIPPKLSVSEFGKNIKGNSSYIINENIENIQFRWQPGFSVHTVSGIGVQKVSEYIDLQKEKHKSGELIDALEGVSI